jgi:hypothetical protein
MSENEQKKGERRGADESGVGSYRYTGMYFYMDFHIRIIQTTWQVAAKKVE